MLVARSVSCTILCYNEDATLEEAVEDVRAALVALGDRAFEILIVDDGSTDRSAEIAAQVAGFIPLLDKYDLVIGSRSGRPGYTQMRMLASHTYIWLAHLLFGLREYDDFNFLYLYRRELFDEMPIESAGVFLCTEILVRALDRGARVAKVEAECLPRRVGKN